jgi:hypothetical protein
MSLLQLMEKSRTRSWKMTFMSSCGQNHMHDKAAVHKDEWEDFFQHHNTLHTDKFWTTTQGKQAIDWKKLISSMVHFVTYMDTTKNYIFPHRLTPPFHAARLRSSMRQNRGNYKKICTTTQAL